MFTELSSKTKEHLPSDLAKQAYELVRLQANQTQSDGKLTNSVVEKLIELGLFRIGLPNYLHGLENHPIETLKVYETLASADASVAWVVWNNHTTCILGRYLDKTSQQEIFSNPSHIYVNAGNPQGVAQTVSGGYKVSGQWSIVSGCQVADWFALRCLIHEEKNSDALHNIGSGAHLKWFFIPKKDVQIIDTWQVSGLNGTGSHDVLVKDTFVKKNYAIDFDYPITTDNVYSRLPFACMISAGCAAIALGVLKAATEELIKICYEKITPTKNPDLRDRTRVQAAIAKSRTLLASKRLQLHSSVTVLWTVAQSNHAFTDEQIADVWSASCEAAKESKNTVAELYEVAGTVALYKKNLLEKALRDIYAILQHGIVQPHWLNQAGMVYLGLTPPSAMFKT